METDLDHLLMPMDDYLAEKALKSAKTGTYVDQIESVKFGGTIESGLIDSVTFYGVGGGAGGDVYADSPSNLLTEPNWGDIDFDHSSLKVQLVPSQPGEMPGGGGGKPGSWIHTGSGYTYGALAYEHADGPLPEALCGNCRRDWHEAPLTERVASMWDQTNFDENYDPDTDDSQIICSGSQFHGPALQRGYAGTWTHSPVGGPTIIFSSGVYQNPFAKMYDNLVKMMDHTVIKSLVCEFKLDEWMPKPWDFLPEPSWKDKQGSELLQAILDEANLTVECKTWYPDVKDVPAPEYPFLGADIVPQAAIEAAPKAIAMDHCPPVAPGFDFSHIKDVPGYYQPPKKGKKKK